MQNLIVNKQRIVMILSVICAMVFVTQYISYADSQTSNRLESHKTTFVTLEKQEQQKSVHTDFNKLIEISDVRMHVEENGDVLVLKEMTKVKTESQVNDKRAALENSVSNSGASL